jgi:hypothetical protein
MSVQCKFERSLLSHEENEAVKVTHYPAIYELDAEALQTLRKRLRDLRDKERTQGREKRREMRGKGAPRGGSFPGTAEKPMQRKQVFAAALKRVNKEAARVQNLAVRSAFTESARRALAMRRAGEGLQRPPAGRTAHDGMQSKPSGRRKTRVNPSKVGSVSQATKNRQAARDSRT